MKIVVGLALSLLLIWPFFHSGYFPTHDGEWAVVRQAEMVRELKDFQIPARYSLYLNSNFGYPLFNFAYPLPYYLGAVPHFFGLGYQNTIKLLFALSTPLSFLFMFLLSRRLWKNDWAGFVSGILYVFLPYRVIDLYVRGSLGESLGFVFYPAILYFLLGGRWLWAALCLAALITTHNVFTILYLPILFVFLMPLLRKTPRQVFAFLSLGLGLSAFFWLPAILEKNNIALSLIPIASRQLYFANLSQVLLPHWGGYGTPTSPDAFSYQLGPLWLVVPFLLLFKKLWPYLLLAAFLLLLLFPQSAPFWKWTPLFKEINYPWILLGPLGFLLALLAGFLSTRKLLLPFCLLVCVVAVVYVLPHAHPGSYFQKPDDFYASNQATTTSSQELTPVWVKTPPTHQPDSRLSVPSNLLLAKSNQLNLTYSLSQKQPLMVALIDYPGWKTYLDGKEISTQHNNNQGLIAFDSPAGDHNLSLKFGETPLRLFADGITLLSAGLFLMLWLFPKRLEQRELPE